ncbi:MAG: response regulator transcription factor, partial [Actinomycetota bacterium]|nr:response regulator transcription factor [Actinomycetota bacterium]
MTDPPEDQPVNPDDGVIRIYLVDDHGVVRRGMRAYLEMIDDMQVVGEAPNGEAAVDELGRLAQGGAPPDVVMMDLLMPGMDGITATGLIRDRHPEIEVVALTSFVAQDKVQAALAAGASGY